MFNRRIQSEDGLGMPEPLNEKSEGKLIRTNHLYLLKFTNDREELFDTIIRRTARLMNPIQLFYSTNFTVGDYHDT